MKHICWASPRHWVDSKWSKTHYLHPDGDKTLCGYSFFNLPSWAKPFDNSPNPIDCKKCLKIKKAGNLE